MQEASFLNIHQKSNHIRYKQNPGNTGKALWAQQSPGASFLYRAAAAVIGNKQSVAPSLPRACGLNNASLAFMINSSGASAPVYHLIMLRLFLLGPSSFK